MGRYFIVFIFFVAGVLWMSLSCSSNNTPASPAPVTVLVTATFTPTVPQTPSATPSPTNSPTATVTSTPTSTPDFTFVRSFPASIYDLAADSSGNVYALDNAGTAVTVYDNTGSVVTHWGSFVLPIGIDLDGAGNAYVLDRVNQTPATFLVKKYTTAGVSITQWQVPVTNYLSLELAVDGAGNVFFNSSGDSRIYKYSGAGVSLTSWFSNTNAIAVDSAGTTLSGFDGTQIKVYTTAGASITVLNMPTSSVYENGFAVDSAGNFEINTSDCYVTKFSPTGALLGRITIPDFCAGPALLAPITLDSSNNLYVGFIGSSGTHIDVLQPR